jgi:hypothetical protein
MPLHRFLCCCRLRSWRRSLLLPVATGVALCAGLPTARAAIVSIEPVTEVAFDAPAAGGTDVFLSSLATGAVARMPASVDGANDARPAWAPGSPISYGGADADIGQRAAFPIDRHPGVALLGVSINGIAMDDPRVEQDPTAGLSVTAGVPPGATSGTACGTWSAGFERAPGITQMAAVGTLTVPGTNAVQTPCESQPILYQSDRTGDYDVWIADPVSGQAVDLLPWPGSNETAVAVSAASRGTTHSPYDVPLVAFVSDRGEDSDVYVYEPDKPVTPGINPSRVTTSAAHDLNPDFSVTARRLVFQSDRERQADLWSIELVKDARGAFTPELGLTKMTVDEPPSFDPGSFRFGDAVESLVYAGEEDDGGCALQEQYWTASQDEEPNPAGALTNTVSETANGADAPAWSPAGTDVAYHLPGPGSRLLRLAIVPPFLPAPLPDAGAGSRHVTWRPRPTQLASPGYHQPLGRTPRRKRRPPTVARAAQSRAQRACDGPPTATFTADAGRPGQQLTLDARSSTDAGGSVVRYDWDLDGDRTFESTASGPIARITLPQSEARAVEVGLRVLDDSGTSDIVRQTVGATPVASTACTITGTPRRDHLVGTSRRDVICGLGGNDVIRARGGNDVVRGGPGRDSIDGGPGRDELNGESGADAVRGAAGDDRIDGGSGADTARGGNGDDRLRGASGSDDLRGEAGRDRLLGERGNDRLSGGAAGDRMSGGPGRDRMTGGAGPDRFTAHDGVRDVLDGGAGRDRAAIDRRLDRVRRIEAIGG